MYYISYQLLIFLTPLKKSSCSLTRSIPIKALQSIGLVRPLCRWKACKLRLNSHRRKCINYSCQTRKFTHQDNSCMMYWLGNRFSDFAVTRKTCKNFRKPQRFRTSKFVIQRPFFLLKVQVIYIVKPTFFMRLFSLKGIHHLNTLPQKCTQRWLYISLMKRCKKKTHPAIYNKQFENNALVIRG